MHIGILQTGHMADAARAETGDYDEMFMTLLGRHGLTFTTWDVEASRFPDGPEAAEGWLITGSRHGAYEDHPWIPPLETLIRDIVAAGRPLVGICFGHQIIATALGGRVEKFAGGWTVGPTEYRLEDGSTRVLNAWHQDQVLDLPEGAHTFATSDTCAHAGYTIGDTVLTWQPHPEYGTRELSALMTHRGGAVDPERLAAARDRLGGPTDRHSVGAEIAAFLKAGRASAEGASDVA